MQQLKEHPNRLQMVHHNSQDGPHLWSALANVYHDHGFADGYERGVSESLASAFEATEAFLAIRGEPPAETRQLLHAFIDFFEERVKAKPARPDFIDGLGI